MKPNISDPRQAKEQVELWTPWGVLSVARDDSPAASLPKFQTNWRLPVKPSIPASDSIPHA